MTDLATREISEGVERLSSHETSAIAVAAQAKAAVEARYLLARAQPRNMDDFRTRMLKECKRPSFAASALYHKPVGNTSIAGPGIRFAEAVMRSLGNLLPENFIVYDDDEKLIMRTMVTDLESNLTFSQDLIVKKAVERKNPTGREVISKRLNSQQQLVYLVRATDDEVLQKTQSALSKAWRNSALRLVPGDIMEECLDQIRSTLENQAAKDPDAERKRIIDAFAAIGIKASMLVVYLGHDLDTLQPAEIVRLRGIHSAIKDGTATWSDYVDQGVESGEEKPKTTTDKVKDKVKEKLLKGSKAKSTKEDFTPEEVAPAEVIPPKATPEKNGDAEIERGLMILSDVLSDLATKYPGKVSKVLIALDLPVDMKPSLWDSDKLRYAMATLGNILDNGISMDSLESPPWAKEGWSDFCSKTLELAGLL